MMSLTLFICISSNNYEFVALILHFLLLLELKLIASDCGALNDAKILVFPAILGEFLLHCILARRPEISMQFFELPNIQSVLASSDGFPDVFDVAGLEAIPKEFVYDLLEPLIINVSI